MTEATERRRANKAVRQMKQKQAVVQVSGGVGAREEIKREHRKTSWL